jgi:hypothetical protein
VGLTPLMAAGFSSNREGTWGREREMMRRRFPTWGGERAQARARAQVRSRGARARLCAAAARPGRRRGSWGQGGRTRHRERGEGLEARLGP